MSDGATPSRILVVLGSPITADAKPGEDMKQRLDHVWQNKLDRAVEKIVVTGGTPQTYGSSGIKAEAHVMKEYLVANGIPSDKILAETRAMHTFHNALYSRQILKESGISAQQITILTHDWHMPRSLLCFQIVWCDDPAMKFNVVHIRGNGNDPAVVSRLHQEIRLTRDWLYVCIEEENNSPLMPPKDLAAATASAHIPNALRKLDELALLDEPT